jgi:hypothetical protein
MKAKQKNGAKLTLFIDKDITEGAKVLAAADRRSVSAMFEEMVIAAYKSKFKRPLPIRPVNSEG